MTSLVLVAPEYKLKYDQQDNSLRDLTSSELKICYGNKGNKILCPCSNKEYGIQPFITHIKSGKHQAWINKEKIEYIKEYGHCGDAESTVVFLRQQVREYKVLYANLTNTTKNSIIAYDKKLEVSEQQNRELLRQIEILQQSIPKPKVNPTLKIVEKFINLYAL